MPERETAFKTAGRIIEKTAKNVCLALLRFYILVVSPVKPRVCRFYPSCSQYTYEAVTRYGIAKGLFMGAGRILRCHPFNPGGYHPVE